jgi:hypothetical protein
VITQEIRVRLHTNPGEGVRQSNHIGNERRGEGQHEHVQICLRQVGESAVARRLPVIGVSNGGSLDIYKGDITQGGWIVMCTEQWSAG